MHVTKQLAWLVLLLATMAAAQKPGAPKALFYMNETSSSVNDFLEHASRVDILVPAWYQVDGDGLVTGAPDLRVVEAAKQHHVIVMPIVALFNKKAIHSFFLDAKAHQRMNDALIRESKAHGYSGFQFDFEDIDYLDRDLLSALIKETADALHAQGLELSIATVPNAPGYPGTGGFSKWIWTDWRGAYDLQAIAKSVDLLCLMTYDQHTRWTTPGPVAGWGWTTENLAYALQYVPREKLSLGIPLYGYHWNTGEPAKHVDPSLPQGEEYKPNYVGEYISQPNSLFYARSYGAKPEWDPIDHTAWFWFYRDQMREYIFFTDRRTFEDRYRLAEKEKLQGFCSWVLGEEDPEIWTLLPEHK